MWDRFNALPAYLGGKRKLAPVIFALLATRVSRSSWPQFTFVDAFLGGGSVSLFAKAQGFRVACNDLALRSAAIGRAVIANSSITLNQVDVALLLREPACDYPRVAAERYSPRVFSKDHARLLDRALWWARTDLFPEPKRSLALVLLIKWALRIQPMSMLRGTDARAAFGGNYDGVSLGRVGHYLRSQELLRPAALWRLAQEINLGVFPGQGSASQQDALAFLAHTVGDVVYLDPPYPTTTAYEREYEVLDELLEGESRPTSPFSTDTEMLISLFDACRDIPTWLVSLNNAVFTLDQLLDLVRRHRPEARAVQVPYRHLASIASEEKNERNQEFVVLARQ
jgi:hypothetical protein